MKTKCPACGATNSLDALLGHSEASRAFLASLKLTGELAAPLIKYLGLFRSETRDLTFDRTAKLLNEIAPDIVAKKILRNRNTFPAPPAAWIWAINIMLERREQCKLQLPLKNHGYLYEVISSYKQEYAPAEPVNLKIIATEKSRAELLAEQQQHEQNKHANPAIPLSELLKKAKKESQG